MIEEAKYLTGIEKKALSEIKGRISALFDIKQYVLFGSKARGDFEEGSDIDLLIVSADALNHAQKSRITHEILLANLKYETNFSRTVIDEDTWNSQLWQLVPLHRHVEREGIVVT
jgi:predicted nucleotidyltransferase